MAEQDDSMNEDQWLYGDGEDPGAGGLPRDVNGLSDLAPGTTEEAAAEPRDSPEPPPPAEGPGDIPLPNLRKAQETSDDTDLPVPPGEEELPPAPGTTEPAPPGEGSPKEGEEEGEDDDDDDDSDDDIRVTINPIKPGPPQYASVNKMRGPVLSSGVDKLSKPGKFSIDEFESIGTINGLPAHEFSIDALEEKPWRKPGADITDYFNYGFNEDTWRAYCERQKTLRIHESGVGLSGLGVPRNPVPVAVMSDGSKYGGMGGMPPMGVPPPTIPSAVIAARKTAPVGTLAGTRRTTGVIDVIGGGIASRRTTDSPPKENVIQVMTSERRDFRKSFDMTVPPPGFDAPPPGVVPPVMTGYGGYGGEYYGGDVDYYGGNFEPTQEMQSWGNEVRSSRHRDRRNLRGSPISPHKRSDRHAHGSSVNKEELPGGVTIKQEPVDKGYKERERDRDRSDRHKESSSSSSRHRHRSRSRSADRERRSSRKHKSRSRSPSHRSHKKKKSKKSDKRDSERSD